MNPFGGGEAVEKEETLWKRHKGKEYVCMPLLEVSVLIFTFRIVPGGKLRFSLFRTVACVVANCAKATASTFLTYIEDNPALSYTSSLFTPTSFRDEFGEIIFPDNGLLPAGKHSLSIRDTEVLLKWLSRDCGAVVMDDKVSASEVC